MDRPEHIPPEYPGADTRESALGEQKLDRPRMSLRLVAGAVEMCERRAR
jgi:hypothetical protein